MKLDPQAWIMMIVGFVILGGGFFACLILAWRRHSHDRGWAEGPGLAEDIETPESTNGDDDTGDPS